MRLNPFAHMPATYATHADFPHCLDQFNSANVGELTLLT